MRRNNRRRTPRFDLRLPLRIQPLDERGTPAQVVESSNISSRGVYFTTDLPLQVGTSVEIRLTMPEEMVGKPAREWHCNGRVVRVLASDASQGKLGVGIVIEHYGAMKGSEEAELSSAVALSQN